MPDSKISEPCFQTIIAFDFGLRRIGVAVGQSITGSASPLGIVPNGDTGPDHKRIDALIDEWRPDALIVGMPAHADGSPSEMEAPIRIFMDELERHDLPIVAVDERYSSVEAQAALKLARQSGSRGKIRKSDVDSAAAVIIAERYLANHR